MKDGIHPCNHEFEKIKLIREYYDYSGFRVGVFKCRCKKCGKECYKKYFRI
ncbi:MAG: hypothetical protein ACLSBC_12970 [[Clostridium] scindens]|uniref:hypothetical protein n=1 Tax=Clostridium scindens (strain JCM 10418 / VPI 12708) TaxID=29347 RepID=UPI003993F4A3